VTPTEAHALLESLGLSEDDALAVVTAWIFTTDEVDR
jgi:hypothetical protein